MEDDRMIFPGDAEFKYVEQARNNAKNSRVYVLKFQGSSERLFFWMQNPSAEKDEENMRKINARISGAQDDEPSGGLGNLDQQQLLSMLTRAAAGDAGEQAAATGDAEMTPADASIPAIPSNTAQNLANDGASGPQAAAAASGGAGGGAFNQAALQQMLANLGGGGGGAGGGNLQAMAAAQANREGPSLSDVLDGRHAHAALAELPDLQEALLEHLPEGDRSVSALNEVCAPWFPH